MACCWPGGSSWRHKIRLLITGARLLEWQQHREAGLRAEDGWLTLAGLFWLKPGNNSIGSGDTNDFLLPPDAPPQVGLLRLSGKVVTFTNLAGDRVTVNKKTVAAPVMLHYDAVDNSDIVQVGPVSFYVIQRGKKLGIRVKDRNSSTRRNFKGTRFFPIDAAFRFDAKFIPDPKNIAVPSVIGVTEMQESPGIVEFNYLGQTYRLRLIYEGKTLFFIFKDLTSEKETYPGGRMLNTPLPQDHRGHAGFQQSVRPALLLHSLCHMSASAKRKFTAGADSGRRVAIRRSEQAGDSLRAE